MSNWQWLSPGIFIPHLYGKSSANSIGLMSLVEDNIAALLMSAYFQNEQAMRKGGESGKNKT